MRFAETFNAIRRTGATVRRVDGEWRVNIPKGTEATAYYTDDADDALATAQAMMKHGVRQCSGCRYVFDVDPTAGDAPCPDCGDCDDCCWENHGGDYHGVTHGR